MIHSIGYFGHLDRDFENLNSNTREYVLENGKKGKVDERPDDVDGVFFGYMQCRGERKYVAVRAQYRDIDVILQNPIPLERDRHTDGKGIGPKQSKFGDESAARLLADMITANPGVAEQLRQIGTKTGLIAKT